MPQVTKPERVEAEILHAGDEIVVERNGEHLAVRIATTTHGSDMVSNIVILSVVATDGRQFTWPFSSDALIERVHQNLVAA